MGADFPVSRVRMICAEADVARVAAPEDEEIAKRAGSVGTQVVRDFSVAERAVVVFFEDALAGEEAEDAIERVFIRIELAGEIGGGAPAAIEGISYAQAGDGVQSLMKDEAVARVGKDCRRRQPRFCWGIQFSLGDDVCASDRIGKFERSGFLKTWLRGEAVWPEEGEQKQRQKHCGR